MQDQLTALLAGARAEFAVLRLRPEFEAAKAARDKAVVELHGEFARVG